jgi:uncharacterized protein
MRRNDREIRDRESLRAILAGADACRLAFALGDEPYIATMNFGFEWEEELPVLYFHCAREGRKLEMMRKNSRVCFELDFEHELTRGPAPCDWGMKYASIVGYGTLSEISDDATRRAGLDLVLRHYGWKGEGGYGEGPLAATTVLSLRVEEMSGKRKA